MKNKLIKIFIGVTIWTFFFSCLAVYAGSKAFRHDPDIVSKLAHQLGMKITRSNIQFGDLAEGAYKETQDTWSFSVPAKDIQIKVFTADIEVSTTDKNEIQIIAEGGLDSSLAPHLIETDFNGDELMLREPEGDVVRNVKIRIEIPEIYKHQIDIESVSGNIYFMPTDLQTIKVKSVSGDIEAKDMSATDLQIESISGDMNLEMKKIGMASIKTISGDVHLDLMNSKGKIDFDIGTISGNINNARGTDTNSPNKVMIKTTSGDIEIL